MGDGEKASLRLQFNPKVRLAFHGATITTDAGLLAFREFDDALGLTEIAEDYLQESRTGRNILHHLVPLLRQSIYSRLAGYDDTNDAVRLSQDPAMRVIVGWQGSERKGASTSEMGRFETEFLTQEDNRQALARMNTRWVERAMAHTLHQRVILDMDSSDLLTRMRDRSLVQVSGMNPRYPDQVCAKEFGHLFNVSRHRDRVSHLCPVRVHAAFGGAL